VSLNITLVLGYTIQTLQKSEHMKILLLISTLLVFSQSAFAETQFSITTKVTHNSQKSDVYNNTVTPNSELKIISEDQYELLVAATETDNDNILIKIVLEANGEIQTPSLLARYGEEVGFEANGTRVFMVVSKT